MIALIRSKKSTQVSAEELVYVHVQSLEWTIVVVLLPFSSRGFLMGFLLLTVLLTVIEMNSLVAVLQLVVAL
jgi:hypothetical protein